MGDQIIFKSRIVREYRYAYKPFIITGLAWIVLILLFTYTDLIINRLVWVKLTFSSIIIDFFLLYFLAISGSIVVKRIKGDYILEFSKGKKKRALSIEKFDCWWNYNFGKNEKSHYFNIDQGKNSALNGRGNENRINLFILIQAKNGEVQYLKEKQFVWNKFPNEWNYNPMNPEDLEVLNTKKIIKLVKILQEKFSPMNNN